ncbi:hypothetical protein [Paraburkholderia hospita]|uniref:hypothetical protein n=1 Tax=Paraburkholderia hospita TaxID=169430 RepID=UPI0011773413|nr:hypothetical protein [Paraburkholderia hospita]
MIGRARAAIDAFTPPKPPDGLGSARLSGWSAQHEVHAPSARAGSPARLVAFVDVRAAVACRESPYLAHALWPHRGYEPSDMDDGGAARARLDAIFLREIEAMQFSATEWRDHATHRTVFYDVRSELPTLAQLLQSLKTLRSHLHGDATVCLFA